MLPPSHSLHFRVHTRVLLTLLIALATVAVLWAEPAYRGLLREAGEAQKTGNLPVLIDKLEAIRAQRPDYPRVLLALTRAYAAAQRPADALAVLDDAARRGLAADPSRDPALATLKGQPDFARVSAALLANAEPRGALSAAQTLPAQSGIIESVAHDAQGNWYFADARERCIWRRAADGSLRRFDSDGRQLLGVFGLALDEKRGALWAGVSAVALTKDFNPAAESGRGYLAEFDLSTGALRRRLDLPASAGGHVLGSLRLADDGSLFATDSSSPVVWRVAPGAAQAEAWLENGEFGSLQGLAFSADRRTLFVADYANGLWSVDVATKRTVLLQPADDSSLFGIDDLHFHRDALIGVQNGVNPVRILRIAVADGVARAGVLAPGFGPIADAATGTIVGNSYLFIGNSGWALYERVQEEPPPRDVIIYSTPLE